MNHMEKPKTSSIIWKINRTIQFRKLWGYIVWDIIFACCGIIGACLAMETRYGSVRLNAERIFTCENFDKSDHFWRWMKSCTYTVTYASDKVVIPIGQITNFAIGTAICFLVIQLIGWLFDWSKQNHSLRRLMRPIDELALTTEKLSQQKIDEESLQNLEEAIDRITTSENAIQMGDSDLKGLEDAINNLIKRLRASYREQTRFVDDASHELRTPIAVIQGYASMLERWGMDDRATLEEAVHAISEEAEHMKTLVDQLLFLARGDGGRQNLKEEQINVAEMLKEICEESEMIDHSHRYQITKICDGRIHADYAMMKQAIRILTDNAAKYTPSGGTISFRVERAEKQMIAISVQDEGIGVDDREAAHMFERFFRGDEARGSTKGSGLGLSIAKWIVDRHNGEMCVLSYKGIGTRMTIKIPEC